MKAWIGAMALVGTLASGSAMATLDGNDLLNGCKEADSANASKKSSFTAGYCYGIVVSTIETSVILKDGIAPNFQSCVPTEMTNQQAVRIVIKYLQANPEQLHFPGSTLVIRALHKAFPCKS
jgi:hypothetical protein